MNTGKNLTNLISKSKTWPTSFKVKHLLNPLKRLGRASADDHAGGPDEDDAVQVGGQRGEPHRDAQRQPVR